MDNFDNIEDRQTTFKTIAAKFIFLLFSVLIVVISAITSFSFFYTYFGSLIPNTVLDETTRRIISGLIGTLLFDFAAVIWLLTFLHHSETKPQRAVSIAMAVITFMGASAASVAYLSLSGQSELVELDAVTQYSIGMISLVVVVFGIVANFASAQLHNGLSLESKRAMSHSDQRDMLIEHEEKHAKHLTNLVGERLNEEFLALAPELARSKAATLAKALYGSSEKDEVPDQLVTAMQEANHPEVVILAKDDGEGSPN
jgi:hypothetical protein